MSKTHYNFIDSIRGIAILMVIVFHSFSFKPLTENQNIYNVFLQSLSMGVPLFFVLSGFLIGNLTFAKADKFSSKEFMIRRFARIYPAFLLSVLVVALLGNHVFTNWKTYVLILANLFTLPSILSQFDSINPVAWSLFVEIHFYLFFPLIYFMCRRLSIKHAELLSIITLMAASIWFRYHSWSMPAAAVSERFFKVNHFPGAMDYFCWGIFYALLLRSGFTVPKRTADKIVITGLVLLMATLFYFTCILYVCKIPTHYSVWWIHESIRLAVCLSAFLLLFTTQIDRHCFSSKIFGSKILNYIGLVSYEWFLFHLIFIPRVRYHCLHLFGLPTEYPSHPPLLRTEEILSHTCITIFSIILSFFISAAIYHWFSLPLMRRIRG